MAQSDALKKYLDAGMAFTHLTRARAEQVVKDLVAAGELQRSQAKSAIDELLERSRKNAETLTEQVRKEVDDQLASLGLARKADVERLEAELAELRGKGGAKAEKKTEGAKEPKEAKPERTKGEAERSKAEDGKSRRGKTEGPTAADGKAEKRGADKAGADKAHDAPPSKATPAKQAAAKDGDKGSPAKKAAKAAKSAKSVKKAADTATSPVSTELPGRKVNEGEEPGEAKPAKKAAKGSSSKPEPPGDKATPAKKTAKKQG